MSICTELFLTPCNILCRSFSILAVILGVTLTHQVICKDIPQNGEIEKLQKMVAILGQQLQETKAELQATAAELKASKDLQRKTIIAVSVQ